MPYRKLFYWIVPAALLILAFGLGWQAAPAQAQVVSPGTDEPACLSCHENLYYLHDTGKHYCLTAARTRCVDCHGGDPVAFQKDAAHTGRSAHPILADDISRCQTCHPQDAAAHVETFARVAGFSPVVLRVAAPVPVTQPEVQDESALPDMKTLAGMGVLLTVIAGLLAFCALTHKACRKQQK